MKKFSWAMLALALVLGLAFVGCSNGSTESDSAFDKVYDVSTNAALTAAINEVHGNAGKYLIKVSGNLTDFPGGNVGNAGVDVTIRGTGSNKITWKYEQSSDHAFVVDAGKLTLEKINVVCTASPSSFNSVIYIMNGGTLEMKDGAVISGDGPIPIMGVNPSGNATFIMSGGTIENVHRPVDAVGANGIITITKGTIRNAEYAAIELYQCTSATVTISGGDISAKGPGIAISGSNNTVTISGGKISGELLNGVYVSGGSGHTITKTGGTVTGGYAIAEGALATFTGF